MASTSDESPVQTDEEYQVWAHEHLLYEADTLVFAMRAARDLEDETPEMAFAIESWAVHTRCLQDFIWADPSSNRFPGDAFATDFCEPGVWRTKRGPLPQALRMIKDGCRFGREIVHLTYHRASVRPNEKAWPIGRATVEVLDRLNLFAALAGPERLRTETRDRLRVLYRDNPLTAAAITTRVATGVLAPVEQVARGTTSHRQAPGPYYTDPQNF